jgi:hypothetical protein
VRDYFDSLVWDDVPRLDAWLVTYFHVEDSPYVRAIGPRASEPPDVVVEPLPSHPTAGDLVRRAISESVLQLLQNDVVMRIGEDVEGVHRARVATRHNHARVTKRGDRCCAGI